MSTTYEYDAAGNEARLFHVRLEGGGAETDAGAVVPGKGGLLALRHDGTFELLATVEAFPVFG